MSGQAPDPPLKDFEASLAALTPAPAALDRDRLMFQAGALTARRRGAVRSRAWPVATAALALATVMQAGLLATRPRVVRPVERIVYLPAPVPPAPDPPPDEPGPRHAPALARRPPGPDDAAIGALAYLELRRQVVQFGLDALPAPASAPRPATASAEHPARTRTEPLEEQLGLPPDALGPATTRRFEALLNPGDPS